MVIVLTRDRIQSILFINKVFRSLFTLSVLFYNWKNWGPGSPTSRQAREPSGRTTMTPVSSSKAKEPRRQEETLFPVFWWCWKGECPCYCYSSGGMKYRMHIHACTIWRWERQLRVSNSRSVYVRISGECLACLTRALRLGLFSGPWFLRLWMTLP